MSKDTLKAGAPTKEKKKESKADVILQAALSVKVAVYANGIAAGLGLTPKNVSVLHKLYNLLGADVLRDKIRGLIDNAIAEAEITYGIDEEAIVDAVDVCMTEIETDVADLVARKIAQGDMPKAGVPAHLDYLFNPDNKPMALIEGVPNSSDKVWVHVVHKGDSLVQLVPAEEGQPGRNVLGADIALPPGEEDVFLNSVIGANTEIEGSKLVATCEGACEENALGRLRVIPEIVVKNVDALSGNIPEAGSTHASVLVRGSVHKPYCLSTTEVAFIGEGKKGGGIEKLAHVTASKLVVNGLIQGVIEEGKREQRPAVDVDGLCVARGIDGALVHAGALLVAENCRSAVLDIDEVARIDGNVLGGQVVCRQVLNVAGCLGSAEGTSNTRIMVPLDGGKSRKMQRLDTQLAKKKKSLAELRQQQQVQEMEASKRAKSDPFWSDLLAGNMREAKSALENRTMRQFKDMVNRKKKLGRMVQLLQVEMKTLQEKKNEESQELEAQDGVVIRVKDDFHLDGSISVTSAVTEEDLEVQVTYIIDGKTFRNHTLKDLQQYLSRQASEYIQQREEAVGTRKEAINKMFEGREAKPTGPTITHKTFELDFEWTEQEDAVEAAPSPLKSRFTARIHTKEIRKMTILSYVTLRETQKGVEINVTRSGPRPVFSIGKIGSQFSKWQDDTEVVKTLEELAIRGLSAKGLFKGLPLPEQSEADQDMGIDDEVEEGVVGEVVREDV